MLCPFSPEKIQSLRFKGSSEISVYLCEYPSINYSVVYIPRDELKREIGMKSCTEGKILLGAKKKIGEAPLCTNIT